MSYTDEYATEETYRHKAFFFPHSLENPLTDTRVIRIKAALGSESAKKELSRFTNLRREHEFINSLRALKTNLPIVALEDNGILMVEDWVRSIPLEELASFPKVDEAYALLDSLSEYFGDASFLKSKFSPPVEMLRYYSVYKRIIRLVNRRRTLSVNGSNQKVRTKVLSNTVTLSQDFCSVLTEDKILIASADTLLGWLDFVECRWRTVMASCVLGSLDLPKIQLIFNWQIGVIREYGNDGYPVVKCIESIAKCAASRASGGSTSANDSLERMITKIEAREKNIKEEIDGPTHVRRLITILDECTIGDMVEIFGMMKSIGYPVVDVKAGGVKSRDIAQQPSLAEPGMVNRATWWYCHLTVGNYIKRTGLWPRLDFGSSKEGTRLRTLYSLRVRNLLDEKYPLSDWDGVYPCKMYEFDAHCDYLDLVDDKSCSGSRSDTRKAYQGIPIDPAKRRVLGNILSERVIDTEALINMWANWTIPDELKCILLRPKEKEFKLEPRMFCMLPFAMRMVFGIIQENVKAGPFKDLPYQSMTMDQAELSKTLLEMTKPRPGKIPLFIELDLSSWNLRFNEITVNPVGKVMDYQFFGEHVRVFGRSHQFFRECEITVWDPSRHIPALDPQDPATHAENHPLAWTDHHGGFEGIDQATWTVCTMLPIFEAMDGERAEYKLMGQGDNQTLVVWRQDSTVESDDKFLKRITAKIENAFKRYNHEAKPDEFVESTTVFTYSKKFFISGAHYPMELKYASKIAPKATCEIPSLIEDIGAIYAGASALSDSSVSPIRLWHLANIAALEWIDLVKDVSPYGSEELEKTLRRLTQRDKTMILVTPSIIGGFPVVPWTQFLVRGCQDHLSDAIASINVLSSRNKDLVRLLSYLDSDQPYSPFPDLQNLIMDPQSIPLLKFRAQREVIAEEVDDLLKTHCRNEDLQEVFGRTDRRVKERILTGLSQMRPLYPKICQDIYKISAPGKIDSLKRKFSLTRTFVSLSRSKVGIGRDLTALETRAVGGILSHLILARMAPLVNPVSGVGIYEFAVKLRERWGIKRSELLGVTCYHPLSSMIRRGGRDGVIVTADTDPTDALFSVGPYSPFIGKKTEEKRAESSYRVEKAPGINELKRVALILSSGSWNYAAERLIEQVIESRTTVSLDLIREVFPRVIGGSLAHRYDALGGSAPMSPAGTSSYLTHLTFNTDNCQGISASKKDYPIAFQWMMSWVAGFLRFKAMEANDATRRWSLSLTNEGLPEVHDRKIEAPYTLLKIPAPRSRLMHISGLNFALDNVDRGTLAIKKVRPNLENKQDVIHVLTSAFYDHWCQHNWVKRIVDGETINDDHARQFLGAVEFDAVGGNLVYEAALSAAEKLAAEAVIEKALKSAHLRMSIPEVASALGRAIAASLHVHVTRQGANVQRLARAFQLGGRYGDRLNTLAHRAATDLLDRLNNTERSTLYDPLVSYVGGSATSPTQMMVTSFFGILYRAQMENTLDISTDDLRWSLGTINGELRSLLAAGGNPYPYIANLIRRLYYLIRQDTDDPRATAAIKAINQLAGSDVAMAFPAARTETVRWLRECKFGEGKAIPPTRLLLKQGSVMMLKQNAPSGAQALEIDYWVRGPTRADKLTDRDIARLNFGRGLGIATSVTGRWHAYFGASKLGLTLVVGTGSGGIQAALGLLGVRSEGIDLHTEIPIGALGMPRPSPAEVVNFRLEHLATYHEASLTESGDWFEIGSQILSPTYKHIVINIEAAGTSFYLEPLIPILRSSWIGTVDLALPSTREDLEGCVSTLSSAEGITVKTVGTLDPCACREHTSYYVIRLHIGRLARLPDNFSSAPIIRTKSVKMIFNHTISLESDISAKLEVATGGLASRTLTLQDNHNLLIARLADPRYSSHGMTPIERKSHLDLVNAAYLTGSLMELLRTPNRKDQITFLTSFRPIIVGNRIFKPQEKYMRRCLRTVPRLLAALTQDGRAIPCWLDNDKGQFAP